jgi:hypothetical protein
MLLYCSERLRQRTVRGREGNNERRKKKGRQRTVLIKYISTHLLPAGATTLER